MEGIGSRLGRASSRYGPAAAVFNGPVRKWKKKWVLASSSSAVNYQTSSQSQSNGQKLLLCRWTPIPPTTSTEADGAGATVPSDEPPRRKFRYTPIAVLEEQKKAELKNIKDEVRRKEMDQSTAKTETVGNEVQGRLNVNEVFEEETKETDKMLNSPRDVNGNNLDLALCLNGQNENRDSVD